MSTSESQRSQPVRWWSVPVFFVVVGLVCVVTAAVGGHLALGLVILAVTVVCGLVLVLLGRTSQTYRDITDRPDERSTAINGGAWAGAGVVLMIGNLGAFVGSLAAGENGSPFYWLLATGALAYIAFTVVLRRIS
jgi:hypothetical protein